MNLRRNFFESCTYICTAGLEILSRFFIAAGNRSDSCCHVSIYGGGGRFVELIPPSVHEIDEFESIDLYHEGKIDSIVFSFPRNTGFDRDLFDYFLRTYKLHRVENLQMLVNYPYASFQAASMMELDSSKSFLEYIETHLVDGCNLNCRSCGHYASLFSKDEIYPLDEFQRDMRRLSQTIDVANLRLMGGEPFLLKNLDEYVKIARKYCPRTIILLVSNGLLIPAASEKVFRAIRENQVIVDITEYPPTTNIKPQIEQALTNQNIKFLFGRRVEEFFMNFVHERSIWNPFESIQNCGSRFCFFLRHGKIYKCPFDALNYKFEEKFPIKKFPMNSGIDIFAENFVEQLQHIVRYPIKMCEVCPPKKPSEPWRVENNPTAEDWIH